MNGRPRLMALAVQPVDEFRTRPSRWSGLFEVLDQRYPMLVSRPELTPREQWRARLRHLHPRRSTVLARSGFSEDTFTRRSLHAEEALSLHAGEFDLVFQLQTLFSPGLRARRFVIYADTTFARVWEEWPAQAPIGGSAARRFMELERDVSARAHTVFTMSEHARRSFLADYGCSSDQVINVGTGMALAPTDLDTCSWSEPVALFVGQDFNRKGGEDLLGAWPLVRKSVPSATLVIVGPRVRRLRLPEGVEWLGRVSDRQRLASIYQRASLFVLPAHFDPMPFVLGEAMGHGLPCIVSPSCGMPELVEDGVCGRVVPAANPQRLAEIVSDLIADPESLERMGRAGHAKVTSTCRWEDVADRMAPRLEMAAQSS